MTAQTLDKSANLERNILQAIRGMRDILPHEASYWQYLERHLAIAAASYGYQEIRLPIVEQTALFKRSIGEATDIVEKEMYIFTDRNNDSLTLRPEGTAVCVRAGIEHGLFYNQMQRLWYLGPMFRHERPQKGRYRQFHHFGVEAFGMHGPQIEAEVILMSAHIWKTLGLSDQVKLTLNSLGSPQVRVAYRQKLVTYFTTCQNQLDEDSQRRLTTNPLRILDSKNPAMQPLIAKAPSLHDSLDETSAQDFQRLQSLLEKAGIPYAVDPRLVRGLDYYNGTVFEWVTNNLGAQNAVCSGGRYDGLVELLGGKSTPAVGFALGMERVIALLKQPKNLQENADIYLISGDTTATEQLLLLVQQWRLQFSHIRFLMDLSHSNFKHQFKRADKSNARYAFILGADELANKSISIKCLREEKLQISVGWDKVDNFLQQFHK